MKLLFVTQKMDRNDDVLGTYHGWVAALAPRFESIEVICLYEGVHNLPANVHVHSLGKDKSKQTPFVYALRFFLLAVSLRDSYDVVFVHMNQEYLLIAGWLWKLIGKRMYMWRNHYAGSWLTDVAASFCTKVLCTSKHSYTAKYKKTVFMPVGVDLERFRPDERIRPEPRSILFLARIAPSKRPDLLIEALGLMFAKGISFTASIYGAPLPVDAAYYESLRARMEELGLKDRVRFRGNVPNEKTPDVYHAHEIFVNCSRSGMFDKTLFEAAACGCLVLASSDDYRELTGRRYFFSDGSASELAQALENFLAIDPAERQEECSALSRIAASQSLDALTEKLYREIV